MACCGSHKKKNIYRGIKVYIIISTIVYILVHDDFYEKEKVGILTSVKVYLLLFSLFILFSMAIFLMNVSKYISGVFLCLRKRLSLLLKR